MIVVNQKAPEFKLFNSEKQEVTLSQFQGQNVLLLFFPFAFTGTCTKELCSVRDEISWKKLAPHALIASYTLTALADNCKPEPSGKGVKFRHASLFTRDINVNGVVLPVDLMLLLSAAFFAAMESETLNLLMYSW